MRGNPATEEDLQILFDVLKANVDNPDFDARKHFFDLKVFFVGKLLMPDVKEPSIADLANRPMFPDSAEVEGYQPVALVIGPESAPVQCYLAYFSRDDLEPVAFRLKDPSIVIVEDSIAEYLQRCVPGDPIYFVSPNDFEYREEKQPSLTVFPEAHIDLLRSLGGQKTRTHDVKKEELGIWSEADLDLSLMEQISQVMDSYGLTGKFEVEMLDVLDGSGPEPVVVLKITELDSGIDPNSFMERLVGELSKLDRSIGLYVEREVMFIEDGQGRGLS